MMYIILMKKKITVLNVLRLKEKTCYVNNIA
jgi:hypothetical protein